MIFDEILTFSTSIDDNWCQTLSMKYEVIYCYICFIKFYVIRDVNMTLTI